MKYSKTCPHCGRVFENASEINVRRALGTHVRCIHTKPAEAAANGGAPPAKRPYKPRQKRRKSFGEDSVICYCPVCGTNLKALALAYAVARNAQS